MLGLLCVHRPEDPIPFRLDQTAIGQLLLLNSMIQHISDGQQLLAIVVSHKFNDAGIHFVTPDELPQQVGFMRYPAGKSIQPHSHKPVPRQINSTQETLFIRKGKLRVDFYDSRENLVESRTLVAGDVIMLIAGGHGFEVIEEIEMIEVKQGPYFGDQERVRFTATPSGRAKTHEEN
jgi:hypothetical protein